MCHDVAQRDSSSLTVEDSESDASLGMFGGKVGGLSWVLVWCSATAAAVGFEVAKKDFGNDDVGLREVEGTRRIW